jgi:hypothetical protein
VIGPYDVGLIAASVKIVAQTLIAVAPKKKR